MKILSLTFACLVAACSLATLPLATDAMQGVFGVDVSAPISQSEFECLKAHDYTFAIVRCYRSVGSPDPACPGTVSNAWAGGMSHVDLYFFPDVPSGNATEQATEQISFIADNNIKFGMMWLDIELFRWGSDTSANMAFIKDLVTTFSAAYGQDRLGIYTSHRSWEPITGGSTATFGLPLWWPRYSRPVAEPNWNTTWSPFGGWVSPVIHQFDDHLPTTIACSGSYDVNWYPRF